MPQLSPVADDVRDALDNDGYIALRQLVEARRVDRALRVLNLAVVHHGLAPHEIQQWTTTTYFPHLRWEPDILELRRPLEELLPAEPEEQWADPQLLLRFPDEGDSWPLTPHVDGVPDWASDRDYRFIAGVALTPSRRQDGCLAVWPGSQAGSTVSSPRLVELDPGDVVIMHPDLRHSSTLNRSGSVRYAVYFRRLAAPASAAA